MIGRALLQRLTWRRGDVVPAPDEPEVDYVVRDAEGRVIEIVLKDGMRIYGGSQD